ARDTRPISGIPSSAACISTVQTLVSLTGNVQSRKMIHAALLLLMLEAVLASRCKRDLCEPSEKRIKYISRWKKSLAMFGGMPLILIRMAARSSRSRGHKGLVREEAAICLAKCELLHMVRPIPERSCSRGPIGALIWRMPVDCVRWLHGWFTAAS